MKTGKTKEQLAKSKARRGFFMRTGMLALGAAVIYFRYFKDKKGKEDGSADL